ncbi:hypothetical protein [Microbispora bryophytorum]|uniref:hypothetical protein n=1 Tax=Microbispora bryophytorum TaxID=1460882 RepID=UPI003722E749
MREIFGRTGRDFDASDVVADGDTEGVELRDLTGSDGTQLVQVAEWLLKAYAELGDCARA